ncbi:hypothetical protein ABH313_04030 [Chromobacterium vaccinii]|uniref:hypothetical protein n=1 Tax=Chromobacterium vaccinii TaxID=1108595 RepID=UPI0032600C74
MDLLGSLPLDLAIRLAAPPSPKMCSAWPQLEQMWIAMFSIPELPLSILFPRMGRTLPDLAQTRPSPSPMRLDEGRGQRLPARKP